MENPGVKQPTDSIKGTKMNEEMIEDSEVECDSRPENIAGDRSPIESNEYSDFPQESDGSTEEENLGYDYKLARKGDIISGIHISTGEIVSGKLRSRAGKLSSKYK